MEIFRAFMRISGFGGEDFGLWWEGFRAFVGKISGVDGDVGLSWPDFWDFGPSLGFRALPGILGFRGEDFGLLR